MVRDFDFNPKPINRRPHAPRQPVHTPRPRQIPVHAQKLSAVPKLNPHPPKQHILDLRNKAPIPHRPTQQIAEPSHTSLRDYHPVSKKTSPAFHPVPAQNLDSFYNAPPTSIPMHRPVTSQPASPKLVTEEHLQVPAKPEKGKPKKYKINFLQWRTLLAGLLGIIGIALLASGLFTPLLQNPHIAVAMYIPIALIFKLKSQVSFTMALFLLILIPVLMIFKQQALAETYAVFCFYFLVIGVVMAAFELRNTSNTGRNNTGKAI